MSERLYDRPDDFEANVRILSTREGGRQAFPFNGIRWDLRYWDQPENELSMVWPEFLDKQGQSLSPDLQLEARVYPARFYIASDKARNFHHERVKPGVCFFCVEGTKVAAAGVITKVTGLADYK